MNVHHYEIVVDGNSIPCVAVLSSDLWPAGDPCPSDREWTVFQRRPGDEWFDYEMRNINDPTQGSD